MINNMTTTEEIRIIPAETNETLRWECEAEAAKSIDNNGRYLIRLLTLDWMQDDDAIIGNRYLEGAAFLFEVLDWQARTIRLVLSDESLDLTENHARAIFETPADCEAWFSELGQYVRTEGWDEEEEDTPTTESLPSRYWQPGAEDANENEQEENCFANLTIPFE